MSVGKRSSISGLERIHYFMFSNNAGNSWPFSHRLRRSLDNSTLDGEPILLRAKRQGSYPGPAWQQPDLQSAWGVPPTSLGGSNNQKSPPQSSHGSSSYQLYLQPSRRTDGGGGSVGGGNAVSVANAPEKLSKWATQLKFYVSFCYTFAFCYDLAHLTTYDLNY